MMLYKVGHPVVDLDPLLIHGFLGLQKSRYSKPAHDWFSFFCRTHQCHQHTETRRQRQTDHTNCDICSNSPHLALVLANSYHILPLVLKEAAFIPLCRLPNASNCLKRNSENKSKKILFYFGGQGSS